MSGNGGRSVFWGRGGGSQSTAVPLDPGLSACFPARLLPHVAFELAEHLLNVFTATPRLLEGEYFTAPYPLISLTAPSLGSQA